jgi:hypothetical protein
MKQIVLFEVAVALTGTKRAFAGHERLDAASNSGIL